MPVTGRRLGMAGEWRDIPLADVAVIASGKRPGLSRRSPPQFAKYLSSEEEVPQASLTDIYTMDAY